VTNTLNMRPGDVATALPSGLALAATFDPDAAYAAGAMVGHEAWSKGFNVLLGGGMNLIRDPRGGRNFEYLSEDPLLSGVMAGEAVRGTQDQHVVSTVKHFAFADQETGRGVFSAKIDQAAARESDLLAFEIAIERGHPGSVMCAYNRYQGPYACQNPELLVRTLKQDWRYPGWVMSDWGAVHGLAAATAGLDQESASERDDHPYFGPPRRSALASGEITSAQLADKSRRILRSMFAAGLFDEPAAPTPIDYAADALVARRVAAEGSVLLVNRGELLPLSHAVRSIVVIGGHADAGVLSGGGSTQVTPVGGAARTVPIGGEGILGRFASMVFDPSSPLAAIKAKAPDASVHFVDGRYPKAAADAARRADVAIVFGLQWMGEGADVPDLSLPSGQDELIAAVTKANPRTVVVLETGGPVAMPWLREAGAVLEAWYPESKGAEAIADLIFGDANPSGRLPVSFPARESDLPRPDLPGADLPATQPFDLILNEGADVGYRWFALKGSKPLFPFGFGLSFTRFEYTNLRVAGGGSLRVSFDVRNAGDRAGADVPQVYLTNTPGGARRRLIGWSRLSLAPGETRRVTLKADPRLLADFDVATHDWNLRAGSYALSVGASSADPRLAGGAAISGRHIAP
jgi:beta-glucosidase